MASSSVDLVRTASSEQRAARALAEIEVAAATASTAAAEAELQRVDHELKQLRVRRLDHKQD